LTSGSSGHLAGVPDSVSIEVVAGLLLMGGVTFAPARLRLRRRAKPRQHPAGAHFSQTI
jgi:hypothetical protein